MIQQSNVAEFLYRCGSCGAEKPISSFYRDNTKRAIRRDGRNAYCIDCLKNRRRRYDILPDEAPEIATGSRICRKCGEVRGLAEFNKSALYKHGRELICKPCKNTWRAARKVRKEKSPKIQPTTRDYQRYYKYKGLTAETFKLLYDAQKGLCGICKDPVAFLAKETCVDHDHKTGLIRGILCGRCNRGIGHMRDDLQILRSAVAYLERYETD